MGPRSTTEETIARWVASAAFVGCAAGLSWALGSTLGLWAGLGFGVIVSGVIGGRLWASHLDNVANERTRADLSRGSGRLQVRDEDDEPGRRPGLLRAADADDTSPWARRQQRDDDD